MDRECRENQLILMDIYYGERELSEEIREHLKDCRECQAYWQELQEMEQSLNSLDYQPEMDYSPIEKALRRMERRERLIDLFKFALIALFYSAIMIMLFKRKAEYFIYFQLFIYLTLPFFSLPLIYHRLKRGDSRG